MTIPKIENPWDVIESIYEFQYFNCPSCSYKNGSKQDFVYHACENHPESVQNLRRISDICLNDILPPWDFKSEFENENIITANVKIEYEEEEEDKTELLSIDTHSSEIRGLCLMKLSGDVLQKLRNPKSYFSFQANLDL